MDIGRQAGAHLEARQCFLRRVLFMRALVAVQQNPHVRAFFDKLVARGKIPLQASVPVMRKLLHAIYGMFTTRTPFAAAKFCAAA